MKLKLFISLLFIITTTLSATHKTEHINDHHESSSCLIYIVNDNLVASDIIDELKDVSFTIDSKILPQSSELKLYTKNLTNQNRAPPLKS
ncbi:MAG: hypothetical protein L3I99_07875 [Sulfurimonas sp.]|nr:hypothetical protein [Sulfurimonas sp.]